ncbi:MAG: DNA polymerase III subunit delta', partial [Pseudomonadota bacterium]
MSEDALPQPDRVDGAPHPRETAQLFGHGAAEATFLNAFNSGRLHHAWLISGPRGIGKATLAWRLARFLLATPDADEQGLFGDALPAPETLDVPSDHPVARRILAGSDPGLFHICRAVNEKTGRLRDQIVADNVRELNRFLGLSATDGGRRVVLIDVADEMNVQAANALLKMLEEPPVRTTFLLVSHQPDRLLPTIRSRCRDLRLMPLSAQDMQSALAQAGIEAGADAAALAELSGGSAGEAVRLHNLDGLRTYAELLELFASLPRLDRSRAVKIAEVAAARGAEEKRDILFYLLDLFLMRLARTGATGQVPQPVLPAEPQVLSRLSATPHHARAWADCAQEISARVQHG